MFSFALCLASVSSAFSFSVPLFWVLSYILATVLDVFHLPSRCPLHPFLPYYVSTKRMTSAVCTSSLPCPLASVWNWLVRGTARDLSTRKEWGPSIYSPSFLPALAASPYQGPQLLHLATLSLTPPSLVLVTAPSLASSGLEIVKL